MMFLYRKSKSRYLQSFILASAMLFLVTGCDQVREKIDALTKPKTVEEVIITVNEKVEQRQFKQAQSQGEEFLEGKEDASGHLAWALAKACAQIGEHDLAIKYTGQALKANAVTGPEAMAEPLLEPVRTDIRFVSLLAGIDVSDNPVVKTPASGSTQDVEPEKSSTAISMDAQGTEVRAGDIVIKLPN